MHPQSWNTHTHTHTHTHYSLPARDRSGVRGCRQPVRIVNSLAKALRRRLPGVRDIMPLFTKCSTNCNSMFFTYRQRRRVYDSSDACLVNTAVYCTQTRHRAMLRFFSVSLSDVRVGLPGIFSTR